MVSLGAGRSGTVYLGTADGHVFASEDGAESWRLCGRVGKRLDAVVTRLVVDSENQDVVYAAVWYRGAGNGGVFQSNDGGRTWKPSGLEGEAVRVLEAAPSNRAELVAGTRTGVFRSLDHGGTWQRISPEGDPELRNVDSVAIDPRNGNVVYVGTYHLPWRTKDGGKTWEPIISGIIDDSDIMSLRLDSTNPERIYMSACSGIYRSENQGGEWTKLQGIPYSARRTQTIVQDSKNQKVFYAGTTEGAWVTRDAGETWARITTKDWVVNSVVVLPAGFKHAGRVIMGTESGVRISDDGQTFEASNVGFTHVVIKQLVSGYRATDHLLMLVQRNGWELLESADHGRTWGTVSLITAKLRTAAFTPDQIAEVYGSPWGWLLQMYNGQLWLRNKDTGSWTEWKPRGKPEAGRSRSPKGRKNPVRPIVPLQLEGSLAFTHSSVIASSHEGLMRCEESGMCARLKAFPAASGAPIIWASPIGDQIAVVQDGKLALSGDGGETASWKDLPIPAMQTLWIDQIVSTDKSRLALGTTAGLFLSNDGGSSWAVAGGGIPSGRVEMWLATTSLWIISERTGGLYLSRDQGASWARIDQDSERGTFASLVDLGRGILLIGSQSEGLLQLEINVAGN